MEKLLVFFVVALAILLAFLGVKFSRRARRKDSSCEAIKEKRDLKEKELSAVTKQFSLQEALVARLKEELDEKKLKRVKENYDSLTDKYERAKNLLAALRAKKEKMAIDLGSLDASYRECLRGQASAFIPKPPDAKADLPGAGKNVFIFHGTAGYPDENWFPWLKGRLEEKGYKVFVPKFPTPNGQSLKAWLKVLERFGEHFDENTILIGHSLGGMFVLRILERIEYKIKAAVFVGTPIGIEPIVNYTSDYNFSGFNFKWDKIKNKAQSFIVYHSDNDPYVSLPNGERLAENLDVKLVLVPKAGHFNKTAGYTKFENLYKRILEIK